MKNIIEYFYRIDVEQIRYVNEKYYILSDNNNYIFEECRNRIEIKVMEETQRSNKFHRIVTNIQGGIITTYENVNYMLLKVILKDNRKITLNDIEEVASLMVLNTLPQPDWNVLWSKKIDNFEKYIMNKDISFDFREYYDYFIGLGENAIIYYQYAKKDNIRKCLTYNRIKDNFTLLELYDPLNVTISFSVKGIAEYIKKEFFNNNPVDMDEIENLNLSYDESILLISRLLFPTYFFDMYRRGREESKKKIQDIINLSPAYEKYLKVIFKSIKKRYKSIPQIKWLTSNQFL